MVHDKDPSEIIEDYHRKKQKPPRMCKNCGQEEMKKVGVRMSASVNYMVWRCKRCNNEDLEFVGLSDEAKNVL